MTQVKKFDTIEKLNKFLEIENIDYIDLIITLIEVSSDWSSFMYFLVYEKVIVN